MNLLHHSGELLSGFKSLTPKFLTKDEALEHLQERHIPTSVYYISVVNGKYHIFVNWWEFDTPSEARKFTLDWNFNNRIRVVFTDDGERLEFSTYDEYQDYMFTVIGFA